ncbi:hypothetical protein EVAR_61679_1 [Eumeta japonica]|uniref:Mariner Mos1 transposase n=1 Tax=Eumeta variegata TaxID=151549 RepID=A0A4C1YQL1_EUMVA|nr:hypothetical protein EVAR_61679_1 [Eumeta japonica]
MKKLCSRWIPLNVTEAQKTDRVTWGNAMLTKFKEGASNLVWDVLTGDETWVYRCDPKTKQYSTVRVYGDEPKPTKVSRNQPNRERSASKWTIASLKKNWTRGYCCFGNIFYHLLYRMLICYK